MGWKLWKQFLVSQEIIEIFVISSKTGPLYIQVYFLFTEFRGDDDECFIHFGTTPNLTSVG